MISNGWREMKLDEVCIKITDGSHTSPPSVVRGRYMASVKDMDDYGFNLDGCRMISESDYSNLVKNGCQPEYGDVLIGKDGANYLQDIFVFKQKIKLVLLSSIAILRPDKTKIVHEFLYYYLSNKDTRLNIKNNYGSGSAIPRMVLKDFKRVPIPLPSLHEQKAIADTLSCLDDKIELNNRINKTLEEMAQAIFKSWFVDFEPFQDGEFDDSGLGRIPKGWEAKTLYDFCEYINGTSFKKDEYSSSGYPIVKIAELKNGISDATQYFNGIKDKKYYLKTGDILFSWSGNPQTSIDTFIWIGGDAILNQHIFKISLKNNDYSFIYLLLKFFKPEFERIASGKQTTGLGHVTVNDLKRIKFPYRQKIVEEFCDSVNPIVHSYMNNLLENQKLISIRDSLLPKLMSGEIRVPIEVV